VTLAAAEDVDVANGTATIRVSTTGTPNKDIIATEQDDDVDNGTISLILNPNESTSGLYVDVSIQIANGPNPVSIFGLDFLYDSGIFTYKSWEPGSLTENWSITLDAAAGKLKIRGIGGTPIPLSGNGSLSKIILQVNCLSYTVPTSSQIWIENYSDDLYDEFLPLPSTSNFTFNPCSRLGDVNGDGNITPGDAQSAFEIYLGRLNPNFCQQMTSDANCFKSITPGDAQEIFEHYLAWRILPQCCTESVTSLADMAQAESITILGKSQIPLQRPDVPLRAPRESLRAPREKRPFFAFRRELYPLDTIGRPGEIVNVPIVISDPEEIESFRFELLYPADLLEYLGTDKSILTRDFEFVRGTEEVEGFIRIEGESQIPIDDQQMGSLVIVTFRVKEGEDLSLPILISNPDRDIFNAKIHQGTFLRLKSFNENARLISLESPIFGEGNTVRIAVEVSNLFLLKAFGLEVSYSKDKMVFLGVRKPDLAEDFISLAGNEVEPGIVRVGGYKLSGVQKRKPGRLVELIFSIKEKGAEVSLIGLVDDIAHSIVINGSLRID
jgi:hypothetical protein